PLFKDRLELPETVIIATLKIDGEPAVPGDFHGWNGDRAAGRIDIGHQPVGPHHGILGLAQGRTDSHEPAVRQCSSARAAEYCIGFTELYIEGCGGGRNISS